MGPTAYRFSTICIAALFATALAAPTQVFAQIEPYKVGQTVEVREGDQWSAATVKGREGRRIQIEYDDGTEEWLLPERLRVPIRDAPTVSGGESAPGQPQTTQPATKPATSLRQFPARMRVEVKWGGLWREATVDQRRGLWHLIRYSNGPFLEWVEPWRIRRRGDTTYDTEYASPNPTLRNGRVGNPPKPQPDAGPSEAGPANVAAARAGDRPDPFAPAAVDWTITDVDRSGVNERIAEVTPWNYRAPDKAAARVANRPIGMSAVDREWQSSGVDVNGSVAMFSYRKGDIGAAEVLDIAGGRISFRGDLPAHSLPASITPDGKRIIAKSAGFHSGTRTRVDVWDIPTAGLSAGAAAKPKLLVSFQPYVTGTARSAESDVAAVIAIDPDHVVTANTSGLLTGFKVSANRVEAVWQCKIDAAASESSIAISPDRQTVAISGFNGVTLLDTGTGDLRGTIETSANRLTSLTFRGDGLRLAAMHGTTLHVFDLASGKTLLAAALPAALTTPPRPAGAAPADGQNGPPPVGGSTGVRWLSGDVVYLTASGAMFNVQDHTVLGIYRLPDSRGEATVGDRLLAAIKPAGGSGPRALCSWDIAALTPSGITQMNRPALAVAGGAAGTKVAIDLGGLNVDQANKSALHTELAEQITRMGWTESSTAHIRLVGRSESGRTEQRAYQQHTMGQPFGGPLGGGAVTEVTVTEKISRLTLEVDGKPLWETRASSMAGFSVPVRQGQSMQEAVNAEAEAHMPSLYDTRLPETLFEPIDTLPPGTPKFDLMPGGVRAVP